jgi:ubiquinol-cytochrome c reductase cytochrome b subunit
VIGGPFATWLWDGEFPGASAFESRLYIVHVLIIPVLIATLIAVHLLLIMLLHHTQFRGRGAREENVVGAPLWPAYTFRSLGLFAGVAGGLFLLGGLVQINPVWLWGPYHPYVGENGAQPDWYLGWLIGALRMMPNWEPTIGGKTIVPNPFWGGALFPLIVFGSLYAWPLLERAVSRDREAHHLLERPRDNPARTGWGVALFTFTAIPFFAGSMDRVYLRFGFAYENAVEVMQWAWILLPPVFGYAAYRIARNLRDSELRPLRGVTARMVERDAGGGFTSGPALLANPSWTPEAAPPAPSGRVEAARITLTEVRDVLVAHMRQSLLGAVLVGGGILLAVVATAALATAAVAALGSALPTWAAALIVAVVIGLIAAAVLLVAARRHR